MNKQGGGQISGNYRCRTEERKKIENKIKRVSEISRTTLNAPTSILQGCQKEEREREKGTEKIFQEITAKNLPNTGKEPLTQIQEAQQVPYKINPRRNTPRHILIKLTKIKDKEKTLKAAREKKQHTREPR